MPSSQTGLHAQGVWFSYDSDPVVRNVSLELPEGGMVALAGPNGSGKTSLLKLLSGALHPVQGQVILDGQRLDSTPSRRIARRISVVPQQVEPRLMFTVQTMVAMGRTPHTGWFGAARQSDREAVQRAISAAELRALTDRPFAELSGGEQQRVMLAMALAQETDYVLLDEPTVHLDLHHQYELLELLRRLHRERQVAVLAVMHDLNLAALYFDRIALMRDGEKIADGPAAEVLHDPDNLAVFRAPLSVVSHPTSGVPQVLLDRGVQI